MLVFYVNNCRLIRVNVYVLVSVQHLAVGVSAKECLDFCIDGIGHGKGGGKADQANGSFSGGESIANLLAESCRRYFGSKVVI